MLTIKEIEVMDKIYNACKANSGSCIISNEDIVKASNKKFNLGLHDVESIVQQLEYDGYFELIKTEKGNKKVNVINLKAKGKAFEREVVQRQRDIIFDVIMKVALCALGAVVTFIVTKIVSCVG